MIVNRPTDRPRTGRRAGFGLVEMAMTGVLIAAAMAATLQVVGWMALDRRAVERRERALLEAGNLMERIKARPWDDSRKEGLAAIELNRSASTFLLRPTLEWKVEPLDNPPTRKKITVEIRWLDRSGRPEAPVRLIAWTHRPGGPTR